MRVNEIRDAKSSREGLMHEFPVLKHTGIYHRLGHPQLASLFPTARNERDRESLYLWCLGIPDTSSLSS